jgi:hypothetical protein
VCSNMWIVPSSLWTSLFLWPPICVLLPIFKNTQCHWGIWSYPMISLNNST